MRARASALRLCGLCCASLTLVAGLCDPTHAAPAPSEIVFFDARVFTADPLRPYAEAVAIRGDRIVGLGTHAAAAAMVGAGARQVDLAGKLLMPGMIDAHAHPVFGGLGLIGARFSGIDRSVPDLVQFVTSKLSDAAAHRGDALVISDLDITMWSHLAELDAALSGGAFAKQRIVLYGNDGHTAWGNRAALTKAGITQTFLQRLPESERHHYGFDKDLRPNGFAVDAGQSNLSRSLPPITLDNYVAGARAALDYMHSCGITGWLDAAPAGVVGGSVPLSVKDPGVLPAYKVLGQSGALTAHVRAYPVIQPDLGTSQIDVVQALQALFTGIPNFKIPGLKVFADGVVEFPSQTASLTKPYKNSGRDVLPLFTPSKLNDLVSEAYRRGLSVHIHAIGDLAVKDSLDAFEAARRANPTTQLPFVLTHAQFVDPEDIARFAQLKVTAALQLMWALADPSTNELVKPYIDAGIYAWMYPARSMLDAGVVIAGASDWPVSSANPFLAVYQAETRLGSQGVLDEKQRMPRAAMLYAYTRDAAAVLDMQDQTGSIAVGKLADLILVDRDVLTVPADELKEARVLWTMFGGTVVYGTSPL